MWGYFWQFFPQGGNPLIDSFVLGILIYEFADWYLVSSIVSNVAFGGQIASSYGIIIASGGKQSVSCLQMRSAFRFPTRRTESEQRRSPVSSPTGEMANG